MPIYRKPARLSFGILKLDRKFANRSAEDLPPRFSSPRLPVRLEPRPVGSGAGTTMEAWDELKSLRVFFLRRPLAFLLFGNAAAVLFVTEVSMSRTR